jgi:hypothetical protein
MDNGAESLVSGTRKQHFERRSFATYIYGYTTKIGICLRYLQRQGTSRLWQIVFFIEDVRATVFTRIPAFCVSGVQRSKIDNCISFSAHSNGGNVRKGESRYGFWISQEENAWMQI